jgi:hypothetical protein
MTENYIRYLEKNEKSVRSALRAASLTSTNIADFAMLNFARWSILHSRIFISSPPYRVGERLLLFQLKSSKTPKKSDRFTSTQIILF